MRKIFYFLSIFVIIIFFFIIIYEALNLLFINNILLKKQIEIKNINSIKPYLKFTHHVREFKFFDDNHKNIENLFFTKRNFEFKNKLIIFQGDSWAEQNLLYNKSNQYINKFLKQNQLSMIDAGVTSYSFSPMTLQLNYLKTKKKFIPDFVIALIDHTDLNDEWCRYKDKIVFKNNKIDRIFIENESSNEIYNYKLEYHNKLEKIINSNSTNLIKLINIFFIKKNMKSDQPTKCDTKLISKLDQKNITKDKITYFKKMANIYIDEVFDQKKDIKLIFITHPWKIHENKNNVYLGKIMNELIDDRIEKSNIFLIDFKSQYPSLYIKNNIPKNQIHIINDPTYHLDEKAHLVFIESILNKVINF